MLYINILIPFLQNELKADVEARPELKDRSIQEGDAYAAVCGEKEPKGRVRVLGLGPTPQEIRTPGLKSYMSTRLQLEVLARKNSEIAQATLEQCITELEEELEEQRMAQEKQNAETLSQHGSNSRQHMVKYFRYLYLLYNVLRLHVYVIKIYLHTLDTYYFIA